MLSACGLPFPPTARTGPPESPGLAHALSVLFAPTVFPVTVPLLCFTVASVAVTLQPHRAPVTIPPLQTLRARAVGRWLERSGAGDPSTCDVRASGAPTR